MVIFWKKKDAERKEFEELKTSAEDGDVNSMYGLGLSYFRGERGEKIDDKLAYQWYKRGADKRHVKCMARAGWNLLYGRGGKKNVSQGLSLTISAGAPSFTILPFCIITRRSAWARTFSKSCVMTKIV